MQGNLNYTRKSIINQLVSHIPFDGWTETSFKAAYKDLGLDYNLHPLLFPRGNVNVFEELIKTINSETLESIDFESLKTLSIRKKIGYIITQKLKTASQYKEILQTGISMVLAEDTKKLSKLLWQEADEIWTMIGDTSLDFSYYSKRSLLSLVLGQTFMYWMQDKSPNHTDTINFMLKKLDNTVQFGQKLGKFKDFSKIATKIPFLRLLIIK